MNGNRDGHCTVILAHGAGALMDSPFMNRFAEGLADEGMHVVRFEFPYMVERRETGKKRPPNRQNVLLETWHTVIQDFNNIPNVVIGGKSMGGRMASMIAANSSSTEDNETKIKGVICLGYPFHPPKKPEKTRVEHLKEIQIPTLILQGERDSLGNKTDVQNYILSKAITIHWLQDGDHSFKPRKSSGITEEENIEMAINASLQFIKQLDLDEGVW